MPLTDVSHQDDAIRRLQRGLRSERTPHAYVFAGPPGVGKEMTATRFAAALLCGNRIESPGADRGEKWIDACGRCEDCVMMAAGTHPDFHRIYRRLNRMHPDRLVRGRKATELSVDVVRHFVIDQIGHSPARGRAKVFVILEADRMSPSAQNALLKTLEEPPGSSHLMLLTPSAADLLETTRSRCQIIPFRPLPTEFVVGELQRRHGLSAGDARFLAELTQGELGTAIRYRSEGLVERLSDVVSALKAAPADPLACGKALADMAREIAKASKSADAVPAEEDSASTDADDDDDAEATPTGDVNVARESQAMVLGLVATVLRDVLRVCVGAAPAALPDPRLAQGLGNRASAAGVSDAIRALAEAGEQIEGSVNTALIFDAVGIAIGRALAPPAMAVA